MFSNHVLLSKIVFGSIFIANRSTTTTLESSHNHSHHARSKTPGQVVKGGKCQKVTSMLLPKTVKMVVRGGEIEMKKWSYYLTIIGFISFIMFQVGNNTIVADSEQDLVKLVSVLQDEHILVNEWSLYSREIVENKKQDEVVSDLKGQFADWTWTESEGQMTAISTSPNYTQEIKVVTTQTNGQSSTYVMYEVKGKGWDKPSEVFVTKEWQGNLLNIFNGKPSSFSCVKGEFGDKMDKALPVYMNGLLDAFGAEEIEALEEEQFLSTSAFSPLFSGTISEDHDMNLQLGLRKPDGMGGNTTLVVGTPIITIEY